MQTNPTFFSLLLRSLSQRVAMLPYLHQLIQVNKKEVKPLRFHLLNILG